MGKGYEVWYYPEAVIIHDAQRISKRKPFSKAGLEHIKGLMLFWLKYGNKLRKISEEIRKT